MENSKDATRKLLELINEFGKVAEYKINTQKSLAFLYANNERSEKEIKETLPFTIKLTKTKYKEKILKAAREKQQITYKGIPIRLDRKSVV